MQHCLQQSFETDNIKGTAATVETVTVRKVCMQCVVEFPKPQYLILLYICVLKVPVWVCIIVLVVVVLV